LKGQGGRRDGKIEGEARVRFKEGGGEVSGRSGQGSTQRSGKRKRSGGRRRKSRRNTRRKTAVFSGFESLTDQKSPNRRPLGESTFHKLQSRVTLLNRTNNRISDKFKNFYQKKAVSYGEFKKKYADIVGKGESIPIEFDMARIQSDQILVQMKREANDLREKRLKSEYETFDKLTMKEQREAKNKPPPRVLRPSLSNGQRNEIYGWESFKQGEKVIKLNINPGETVALQDQFRDDLFYYIIDKHMLKYDVKNQAWQKMNISTLLFY
jgi:uncharacterized protein (DUF2249 family)